MQITQGSFYQHTCSSSEIERELVSISLSFLWDIFDCIITIDISLSRVNIINILQPHTPRTCNWVLYDQWAAVKQILFDVSRDSVFTEVMDPVFFIHLFI